MKFTTVVLTKKKIAVFAALLLCALVIFAAAKLFSRVSAPVFGYDADDRYEKIIAEGMPDNEEKKFSFKGFISKLTGIDLDAPETIVEQFSPVFEGTTTEETADSESEENASESESGDVSEGESAEGGEEDTSDSENTDESVPAYEPPMPDKAQISSSVGLKITNATDYDVDLDALCAEELPFDVNTDEPLVLVMHTHTTECYNGDAMSGETERNTDDSVNVVAVGDVICSVLEENGIKTIHDTTYHDYPSYQGAYSRALTTIDNRLKENPSVKIVLDIHRDAFVYSDGSRLRVACEQNGVSAAQVMIVAGTNSMGLWHDNWLGNLTFAAKIQNAAEIMYPGLMRPVNLRTERFNEHMTRGSLILEVGSNGNTLDEAKEGGKDVARAIAAVLKAEQK